MPWTYPSTCKFIFTDYQEEEYPKYLIVDGMATGVSKVFDLEIWSSHLWGFLPLET